MSLCQVVFSSVLIMSKSMPPNYCFSNSLAQSRSTGHIHSFYTYFPSFSSLALSIFQTTWIYSEKRCKATFTRLCHPTRKKNKKKKCVEGRGMVVSNSCKNTGTPKSGWTFSLPSIFSNSKGCNFSGTIVLAVLLSMKLLSSAEFGSWSCFCLLILYPAFTP